MPLKSHLLRAWLAPCQCSLIVLVIVWDRLYGLGLISGATLEGLGRSLFLQTFSTSVSISRRIPHVGKVLNSSMQYTSPPPKEWSVRQGLHQAREGDLPPLKSPLLLSRAGGLCDLVATMFCYACQAFGRP